MPVTVTVTVRVTVRVTVTVTYPGSAVEKVSFLRVYCSQLRVVVAIHIVCIEWAYNMARRSAEQYNSEQYSTVTAVQNRTVQYSTEQYSTQYSSRYYMSARES